jgi:hypothetical protein
MEGRRGISNVLSVVVFIVIALVGVLILWKFISKNINDGAEYSNDPACFSIQLEIDRCQTQGYCEYATGINDYRADLLIKRKAGRGSLAGLRFILEDALQRKKFIDEFSGSITNLNELSTLSYANPTFLQIGLNATKVSVVALIGPNKKACSLSSLPFACLNSNSPPSRGPNPATSFASSGSTIGAPYTGHCCQFNFGAIVSPLSLPGPNAWNLTECYGPLTAGYVPFGSSGHDAHFAASARLRYCCLTSPGIQGSTGPVTISPINNWWNFGGTVTIPGQSPASISAINRNAFSDCSDGQDNDADLFIDWPYDPQCTDLYDNDEAS